MRGEMLAPAQLDALRAGEIDIALLRPPVDERIASGARHCVATDSRRATRRAPLARRDPPRIDDLRDEDHHRPCRAGTVGDGAGAHRSMRRRRVRPSGPPRGVRDIDARDPGRGWARSGGRAAPTAELDIAGVSLPPTRAVIARRRLVAAHLSGQRRRRRLSGRSAVLRQNAVAPPLLKPAERLRRHRLKVGPPRGNSVTATALSREMRGCVRVSDSRGRSTGCRTRRRRPRP